jgi:hypothetical protein
LNALSEVFQLKIIDDIITQEEAEVKRLFVLVILAIILAEVVLVSLNDAAISVANTGTPNIEEAWIKNPANGHYYMLTEAMSWMDAEAWAQERGGHLVTLRNWEEELWIKDTFGRDEYFWIGFNDIEEEGDWVWSSGEPVVYTNWEKFEPNNCGGWPPPSPCYPEDTAVMNWARSESESAPGQFGDHWNDITDVTNPLLRGVAEMFPDYILTISSTAGGSVIIPGEGEFPYKDGIVVDLEAKPEEGYRFVSWTGDVGTIADVNDASTTITMNGNYSVTASFEEIPPSLLYPAVTTQAASNVTANSATVNMNYTVGNFGQVQVCFAYKKPTDSAWSSTDWVSKAADGAYATSLSGLDSGTQYSFKARLKCDSTVIEGTTLQFTTATPTSAGWCFIATAAYGTLLAEEIQILREFRDEYLLTNPLGQGLVDVYYSISPPIADFITEHPSLKPIVRAGLMPVVAMCSIVLDIVPQFTGNEA